MGPARDTTEVEATALHANAAVLGEMYQRARATDQPESVQARLLDAYLEADLAWTDATSPATWR